MAYFVYNSQLDAFTLYHQVKEEASSHSIIGPALPALGHALSGATGTAISNVITYPLDLVIKRLQVQNHNKKSDGLDQTEYKGLLDAAQKIYQEEGGWLAFYEGCTQDTVKSIADSFLFFLAYTALRNARKRAHDGAQSLPVREELLIGMLSGAFGKFFTTPIQQVVTRKQTRKSSEYSSLSTLEILRRIKKEKGIQGFWSGYSATLVLTLNPSLTFLFHELLLRSLAPKSKRQSPGPQLTFLIAAVSKSVASAITYPFSLAKTRAQISGSTIEDPVDIAGEEASRPKGEVAKTLNKPASRQLTVFASILRVAREEGILALYDGLLPEVMKGFVSHGLTMLMKQTIHTLIIQLYYTVLKTMKRFPSPEELAKLAQERAQAIALRTQQAAEEAAAKATDTAAQAAQVSQAALETGVEGAKDLLWGIVDDEDGD